MKIVLEVCTENMLRGGAGSYNIANKYMCSYRTLFLQYFLLSLFKQEMGASKEISFKGKIVSLIIIIYCITYDRYFNYVRSNIKNILIFALK